MLNLTAPINSLGYGVAGYNIYKELYKLHPSTALYPISSPEFIDDYVEAGLKNRGCLTDAPSVKIWHQNDIHTHIGKTLHVGFPIFELTEFNEEEKLSIQHCDRVFVCSEWAKSIVVDQTNLSSNDIHVVPLGVDSEIFEPSLSRRPNTVFFNCGKWEKRKGHDILVKCFNDAFTHSDSVELWMMCDNPFIGEQNNAWQQLYKNSPLGDKIRIIPRQASHRDVYNIMCQSDCGVFPARAEGWNLELLEMMACGKQVITTNYSAHTQFCNKENSHLIDITNLEIAHDGVFFSGSHGMWANLSSDQEEQLVSHMRAIHQNKQNGLQLNIAGIKTANNLSWHNSAQEVINGLQHTT